MNENIEYLPWDTELKDCPLWFHTAGLQQTASGYGRKLTTSKKALYNGKWYRVYCICFSNIGTCYIISKGKMLYLRG